MSRKRNYIIAGLLAAACCGFMVVFPSIAIYSAQKGIYLWAQSVLPALLPFFICANFLNYMGAVRVIRPSMFPFAMSVLSGYPMGAKIIGDMRKEHTISRAEAKRLISFCSTSGPTFMVGAVGVGMLGSAAAGILIAVSHYLGAVLNGMIYSFFFRKKSREPAAAAPQNRRNQGLLEIFTDAILSAFKSLAIILAYIILFMFLTDLMHMGGLFSWIGYPPLKALAKGFFEMTVGCGALSECIGLSMSLKCVLCTFVLSWGGLSIIGQSMSMLSGSGVGLPYFALTKLTHAILAGIIALLLCGCVL
ncbi:hypothetical protein NE619_11835 [Anaerovorax odorimutans]|uniref:Sporulation integral membrane protein YlbJ n=1 Tax=Anaerovorax odorimutans TaxID=109327 RepID=A0ABT1RQE3_9FIRM|nr:hypothetical protein [Anaerovorax odorimutans]MCQ4637416.1 hypothetical protein [Anaerovorax odorimutans]